MRLKTCDLIRPIICMGLIIPILLFSILDSRVWTWDEAFYGAGTLKIYLAFSQSLNQGIQAFFSVLQTKAPFISWGGLPYLFFGANFLTPELSLMLSQYVALFILVYGLGSLASEFEDPNPTRNRRVMSFSVAAIGILAVPFLQILSRYFFVEILQTLSVYIYLHVFIKRREYSWSGLFYNLILATVFLLIVKVSSPVYVFLLGFGILFELIKRRQEFDLNPPQKWSIPRIMFFWFLIIISCGWYFVNLETLLAFAKSAASGPIALLYGSREPLSVRLGYWVNWVGRLLVWERTGSQLYILVLFLTALNFKKIRRNLDFWILVFQFMLTLALFSTQINKETRYLLPLLPIGFYPLFYLVKQHRYSLTLFFVLSISQYFYFSGGAFGFWNTEIRLPYFQVLSVNNSQRQRGLDVVDQLCDPRVNRVIVIGVDTIDFNADVMRFYGMSKGFSEEKCLFLAHGHAETDIERALKLIETSVANYVVFHAVEDMQKNQDDFNRVSLPLFTRLKKSGWKLKTLDSGLMVFSRPF